MAGEQADQGLTPELAAAIGAVKADAERQGLDLADLASPPSWFPAPTETGMVACLLSGRAHDAAEVAGILRLQRGRDVAGLAALQAQMQRTRRELRHSKLHYQRECRQLEPVRRRLAAVRWSLRPTATRQPVLEPHLRAAHRCGHGGSRERRSPRSTRAGPSSSDGSEPGEGPSSPLSARVERHSGTFVAARSVA